MHEQERAKCHFGCEAQDTVKHYLHCPPLWSALHKVVGGSDLTLRKKLGLDMTNQLCGETQK